MIRTKYLFVAVLACIGLILSAGIFSMLYAVPPASPASMDGAIFNSPQNSYTVRTEDMNVSTHERDVFISKVRTALGDASKHPPTSEQEDVATTSVLLNVVATTTIESSVPEIAPFGAPTPI